MSESKDLVKIEQSVDILNNLILEIETEDDLARFAYASKKLSKMADMIDYGIRKKASEMMSEENQRELRVGKVILNRIEPSEGKIYNPRAIVDALGLDVAINFLQVKNGDFKKYLIKAFREHTITGEQLENAQANATISRKKGFIKITLDES